MPTDRSADQPDRPDRHRVPTGGSVRPGGSGDGGGRVTGALAPFEPRGAKVVAAVLSAVVLVGMVALFVFVRPNAATRLGAGDYMVVLGFCAVLRGILWRQFTVRAVPDTEGVTVRNLLTTRRLAWAEIVSVRYSDDRAWAQLDLSDGDELAVMAIQRADGARSTTEARRLAALVDRYGTAPDGDPQR